LFIYDSSFSVENDETETWFVESGASTHMTCNRHWFENFKETNSGSNIYLGDDRGYQIKGYGNILVILPDSTVRHIQNVMHVSRIKKNLVFVSMIRGQNLKVEFFKYYCFIKDMLDHMKPIASSIQVGGLYKLNVKSAPCQALTSSVRNEENFWRQRLGHIKFHDLLLLQKRGMVNGLPVLKNSHVNCESCSLGKIHRDDFPSNLDRKKRAILELVHTDIWDDVDKLIKRCLLLFLFVDAFMIFTWVYFLINKSHTF